MSTQTLIKGGVSVIAESSNTVPDELLMKSETRLYFDIIQEHSISVQNQITDNYLENNTTIQDHIAKSPIVVSVRGISGELVYTPPVTALNRMYSQANTTIQKTFNAGNIIANTNILTDKLTAIPTLLPPVDNITQMAKNVVQGVEASTKRYVKIFKNFTSDLDKHSRLEQIYNDLMDLRAADVLMLVETPYAVFHNMAIQSITLRQGNENYITDIELTLKQLQYADVTTTAPDTKVMAEYTARQRAKEVNYGKAMGVKVDRLSVLYKFGQWVGLFPDKK